MPSQILSSAGSADMRKEILDKDITQLFVFENRKNIFNNVHKSYRFIALTLQNSNGGGGAEHRTINSLLDFIYIIYHHYMIIQKRKKSLENIQRNKLKKCFLYLSLYLKV